MKKLARLGMLCQNLNVVDWTVWPVVKKQTYCENYMVISEKIVLAVIKNHIHNLKDAFIMYMNKKTKALLDFEQWIR